jgi:hypothetical protein
MIAPLELDFKINIMWSLDLKIETKNKILSAMDISDALEKIFDYQTDKLIIKINNKELLLPLAYTFSDLLPDFLLIINDLLECKTGQGVYGFSQNDVFDADWDLKWDEKDLVIAVNWRRLNDDERNLSTKLILTKDIFLKSWKNIFISLSKFIDFNKITLEFDEDNTIINKLLKKQL